MEISIATYEEAEARARESLSIPELNAFHCLAFEQVGFPYRVDREPELARFLDWNSEMSNWFFYSGSGPERYLTHYTAAETALIQGIGKRLAQFMEQQFGTKARPVSSIIAQIPSFRFLQKLKQLYQLQELRVFEIGPGCGMLGLLLTLAGDRHLSMDCAQGFYLWQNRIYDFFHAAGFCDWLIDERSSSKSDFRCEHLPWWEFLWLRRQHALHADIVIADSVLGEMNKLALRYALRLSRESLEESSVGLFVFRNTGLTRGSDLREIVSEFLQAGYHYVRNAEFHIFALSDASKILDQIATLDPQKLYYGRVPGETLMEPLEVVDPCPGEYPVDVDFLEYLDLFSPRRAPQSKPDHHFFSQFVEFYGGNIQNNDHLLQMALRRFLDHPETAGKRILLYGAGKHTQRLLNIGILPQSQIVGILDDNPRSSRLEGLSVWPDLNAVTSDFDLILVSSDSCETAMTEKIQLLLSPGKVLVSLYAGTRHVGTDEQNQL